jgi:hypothetical protein
VYNADRNGVGWKEIRSYKNGDVELVGQEVPAIGSPHPSISGIFLDSWTAESLEDTHQRVHVTLNYAPADSTTSDQRQAQNTYGEIWEWVMTAQQTHITGAPEGAKFGDVLEWDHVSYDAERDGVATTNRLIGASGEDEVEGVDVYRGTGALRVTKEYANKATVTASLRQSFYELQAHVNSAAWKDWGQEEILYLGARVRFQKITATVDHQFLFGVSGDVKARIAPSTYDEDLDSITMTGVKPFQYWWQEPMSRIVYPQGRGNPTKKQTCPRNAKLAHTYPKGDFSILDLQGP